MYLDIKVNSDEYSGREIHMSVTSTESTEKLRLTPHEAVEIVSVDVDRLVVHATYAPGGEKPPAHKHPNQDEHFEVLAGTLRVEAGGEIRTYAEGEAFDIPRGTAHRMANEGPAPAEVTWTTSPAGRTLEWFRALEAAQSRTEGRKLARVAAFLPLLFRFRDTFRLARG
jgi:mannose-6-phosphate isomerase-like protein (cupin superfamily)